MTTRKRELGPAERAVYTLVTRGEINSLHAPLYRRQLSALASHGLVRRTESGAFEACQATPPALAGADYPPNPVNGHGRYAVSDVTHAALTATPEPIAPARMRVITPPPPAPAETEPMVTIVARVPQSMVDVLDASATDGNRSEAIRRALSKGMGSGMRKAVRRPA